MEHTTTWYELWYGFPGEKKIRFCKESMLHLIEEDADFLKKRYDLPRISILVKEVTIVEKFLYEE